MGVYIPKMLRQKVGIDGGDGLHDKDGDGDGYKSIRASHDTRFFDEVSHLLVTDDRKNSSQINGSYASSIRQEKQQQLQHM